MYLKPISIDVRQIIVNAKKRKETTKNIALWTGVSKATIDNIWKQHRTTDTIEPKPFPGRPSRLNEKDLNAIKQLILSRKDITLEEIIEELDLPIKKSRLSVITIKMGFSFKKRLSTLKSNSVRMSNENEKNGGQHKKA